MSRLRTIGRLRAGGNVALPTSTNMVAWYRKGVGQTNAGGGALSVWADQTGLGGRDYAQGTGASQPAIQGDGTVLFDGSTDYLKTPTFTLNQAYTRYLRFRLVTWTLNDYVADGFTLNTGAIYETPTTPSLTLYAGADGPVSAGAVLNTYVSFAAVFNAGSSLIDIGGVTATGSPSTGSAAGLTLGARGDGVACSNIQVAEEIVYNVAHDATQRAAVIAYLNTL